MKKIILLFGISLMVAVHAFNSLAKVPANTSELILMVPEAASGRNVTEITSQLSSLGGVAVVGYCNSEKCFFLNVNRMMQPGNDNILRLIINMGYHPEIKVNGTIAEAQANCQDH